MRKSVMWDLAQPKVVLEFQFSKIALKLNERQWFQCITTSDWALGHDVRSKVGSFCLRGIVLLLVIDRRSHTLRLVAFVLVTPVLQVSPCQPSSRNCCREVEVLLYATQLVAQLASVRPSL